MKIILLIMIGISILNAGFTRQNDIVIDDATGLHWQDADVSDKMEWEEAIGYCEDLDLGNHTDWRLPNINELKSIIDFEKKLPAIVSEFNNTSYGSYWSSTSGEWDKKTAWEVNFNIGNTLGVKKFRSVNYARCVRSGD